MLREMDDRHYALPSTGIRRRRRRRHADEFKLVAGITCNTASEANASSFSHFSKLSIDLNRIPL